MDCSWLTSFLQCIFPVHISWCFDLMWGWREMSWVWMLPISQLSCLQKAYVDFKKLSNCLLQRQSCFARAVWWQSGMFLISLSEHEQGRALAIPRTAFVHWYNTGLISLFYVGASFQGTFVIPWEMLHTGVLTWLVSPPFASWSPFCSSPELSFCQHEQDLGDVPSSTCRTSWNWHHHCLLLNTLQFGERRRFYAICLFISYSRNYFYLGCYHDNRQTVKSSPNAFLMSNCF